MSKIALPTGNVGGWGARRTARGHGGHAVARSIVWVLLLGVWLFALASLVSFNPGDPPTHVRWPANDPPTNWCGVAGAALAYHAIRLLGWGAWVLLAGLGGFLGMMSVGRRIGHAPVRVIGLVLAAWGVAGLQGLLVPGLTPFPGLAGGLAGSWAAAELAERFSGVGSFVWLSLLTIVGAVVAFDEWLITGPAWAARRAGPAARGAGRAGDALLRLGAGTARLVARLARAAAPKARRGRARVRLTDLDDDAPGRRETQSTPRRTRGSRNVGAEPADADDAPGLVEAKPARAGRGASGGARGDQADGEPDTEPEGEDGGTPAEEEAEAAPGGAPGPVAFNEEELRRKIARLPIRFASQERKVATEDDLRDLQGVTELSGYRFPGLDLLEAPEENFSLRLESLVREQAQALEAALRQYRIEGEVVGIESGPVITLYDVRLAPGTKVSQLTAVSSDVARALKAVNIRIVPNMAGRDTVGVEVPNPTKEKVRLKELMSRSDSSSRMKLPMFLGKDASGEPLIADLTQMPHMLIAGTTGSGKSVAINTIIMGFLYTKKPNELKLVLVDPKMVEMSQFKDIPHLMCPVVTEMGKAAAILEWAQRKMDERYELLAEAGCRDIAAYNDLPWEELKERFNPQSPEEEARIPRKLPYMVFIIDELADLMMTTREVETSIIRIAQKARAVGIHLILATQRPQANVVTGLIKSNMPCRICFKVASGMDSRIVLDQKGGELLLGQGDMLYLSPRSSKLTRAQGTLVDDLEIRRVVRFMRDVAKPTFERQLLALRSGEASPEDEERLLASDNNSSASLAAAQEDPLFDRAVEIVLETKRGSVSLLQRRLAIGYTRASRLIDLMGIAGIISDHKGSVARDVMITIEEWEAMKKLVAADAARRQPGLFEGASALDVRDAGDAADGAGDRAADGDGTTAGVLEATTGSERGGAPAATGGAGDPAAGTSDGDAEPVRSYMDREPEPEDWANADDDEAGRAPF